MRWLRRESDIAQLAAQQDRLLQAGRAPRRASGWISVGAGSVYEKEGSDRVEAYLAHHSDARLLPSPGHLLPGAPEGAGALGDNGARDDGFYYALLHKRPA